MIDALFSQSNYVAAKKLLDATALRQEAIACNIANLETPGFKRLEVASSFQDELKRALGTGHPEAVAHLQPALEQDIRALPTRPDGNNVQLEHELMQLSQNTVAHALETQLITAKLLQIRMAITGRPV